MFTFIANNLKYRFGPLEHGRYAIVSDHNPNRVIAVLPELCSVEMACAITIAVEEGRINVENQRENLDSIVNDAVESAIMINKSEIVDSIIRELLRMAEKK